MIIHTTGINLFKLGKVIKKNNVGIPNAKVHFCPGCGKDLAPYISSVPSLNAQGQRRHGVDAAMPSQPANSNHGWVTMRDAARMMGYSYFWLAHNWQHRLGLHPSNFGHRRMFEKKEIEEYLQRNKFTYRGRPRKG